MPCNSHKCENLLLNEHYNNSKRVTCEGQQLDQNNVILPEASKGKTIQVAESHTSHEEVLTLAFK